MKKTFLASLRILVIVVAMLTLMVACGDRKVKVTVVGGKGSGEYNIGDEVTVEADEPAEGKIFYNWTIDDEPVSNQKTYKFKAEKDVTIKANFKNVYTITVENGTANKESVVEGGSVTITASVPVGKEFLNWTVNGQVLSDKNPYTFVPDKSMTIVANFADLGTYSVVIEGGVGMGTKLGDKYVEGSKISVVANAPGKQFVNWTIDGQEVSTDIIYTFQVTKDVTIKANYLEDKTKFGDPSPMLFFPEAPSGDGINIAMDRMFGPGGGDKGPSIFADGPHFAGGTSIDFILIYVYEEGNDEQPVGYFHYYQNTVTTLDGSYEYTQTQEWSVPGNYYIFAADFGTFLQNVLGNNYGNTVKYYFKNQLIAKKGSNFANSEASAMTDSYYVQVVGEFYLITMENCTSPGGRYPEGQPHTVGIVKGQSATFTAKVPTGMRFVKWQIDGVDQEETGLELTFTPTGPCTVTAVLEEIEE